MKIKERIKNVGFWVSIISAVFLILGAFGVEIGDETSGSIINAICSLLVVTGIVSDPTTGTGYLDAAKSSLDKAAGEMRDSIDAAICGVSHTDGQTCDVATENAVAPNKTDIKTDLPS